MSWDDELATPVVRSLCRDEERHYPPTLPELVAALQREQDRNRTAAAHRYDAATCTCYHCAERFSEPDMLEDNWFWAEAKDRSVWRSHRTCPSTGVRHA